MKMIKTRNDLTADKELMKLLQRFLEIRANADASGKVDELDIGCVMDTMLGHPREEVKQVLTTAIANKRDYLKFPETPGFHTGRQSPEFDPIDFRYIQSENKTLRGLAHDVIVNVYHKRVDGASTKQLAQELDPLSDDAARIAHLQKRLDAVGYVEKAPGYRLEQFHRSVEKIERENARNNSDF